MDPFVGDIVMFAGPWAPDGWAFCDGQLLKISDHEKLHGVIGTTYGGDGTETFALPDLRGRVPIHAGGAPGLSTYQVGQAGGTDGVALTEQELPAHDHAMMGHKTLGNASQPKGAFPAMTHIAVNKKTVLAYDDKGVDPMAEGMIGEFGDGQAHDNRQPYSVVNFIIAVKGLFPSRA